MGPPDAGDVSTSNTCCILCTGLSNRTISTRPDGSRTSSDRRSARPALAKAAAGLSSISALLAVEHCCCACARLVRARIAATASGDLTNHHCHLGSSFLNSILSLITK